MPFRHSSLIPDKPLLETTIYHDTKDPCPVWDGSKWHLFGSGGSSKVEIWNILHATSDSLDGPWHLLPHVNLNGLKGDHVAAPSVIYNFDTGQFNMFVQTEFMRLGGTIERLTSSDGSTFESAGPVLNSIPNSHEAGIYDPEAAVINGWKYITYSATSIVGQPDIYLAKSMDNTWEGAWERIGIILKHDEVNHHNQRGQEDYEWGLEGSQLIELPNGKILLNAVCFLPQGARGTRQRIFFAICDKVQGPYRSLGLVLSPTESGWASGENGHGSILIQDNEIHLFFQARSREQTKKNWRYGHTKFSLEQVLEATEKD